MLLVFNKEEVLLTTLTSESLLEAKPNEQLNNEHFFEFKMDGTHEDATHVKEGHLIAFHDVEGDFQLYEIVTIDDEHDEDAEKRVKCEHASYELLDEHVEDVRLNNSTLQRAAERSLETSRWEVGEVADLGTMSTDFYRENPKECLAKIVNTWGCELRYRITVENNKITGRYVDFLARRGADRGKRFVFGKDLVGVKRTGDITEVKTALRGYGRGEESGDGFGRRITFKDVEWKVSNGDPIDKPLGQDWVGDEEARLLHGRPNSNGTKRHKFGKFEDSEIEDPLELLEATYKQLQVAKIPLFNYEMTVLDLERIAGYEHEKARLGDTVVVLDDEVQPPIELKARIIEYEPNLLEPEDSRVVVGMFLPLFTDEDEDVQKAVKKVNDRSHIWDSGENVKITPDKYPDIVPAVPDHFEAVSAVRGVQLYWDYSAGQNYIEFYELHASEVQGFTTSDESLVYRGRMSGHFFEGESNKQYYFRVRAVNYHGRASAFTSEITATTARIVSEDIFFDPGIAEKLRELSKTVPLLADGTITSEQISELAKELIKDDVKEYTDAEVKAVNDQLMQELADKAGLQYVDGQLLLVNHKVDGLEGTTSQLQNNINSMESAANQLQGRVNDLQSNMADLQVSVNDDISSLQSTASSLLQRANEQEAALTSASGRIVTMEESIDTINGTMSTTINELTSINGIVSEHQTTIQQHAGLISEKASITVVDTINDKVSTVEASVETIAGQVSLKANAEEVYTKSEVNTELGKKVDTTVYNSQMTQLDVKVDGVTADIRSVQSEVSDVDTRLISAQTQLNMQAGLIDAKAERSELTTVDGRVTGVRNDLTTLQFSHNGLNSTVSSLRSDLDGLEIGGRNLVLNSSKNLRTVTVAQFGHSGMLRVPIDGEQLTHGETVTFSVYLADIPEGQAIRLRLDWYRDDNTYGTATSGINRTENGRYSYTTTIPADTSFTEIRARLMPTNWTSNFQIKYKQEKLEKGNKATDWTPAPEETDSAIGAVEQFASSIDQKADSIATSVSSLNQTVNSQGTRLSSAESTITQHATSINLKANATDVYTKSQVDTAVNGRVSTTVYNNKMSQLDLSINGILGRVSNTETSISGLNGEVSSALSQIASLDIRANGIVQSVSEVRADLNGLEIGGRNLIRNTSTNYKTISISQYYGTVDRPTIQELGLEVGDTVTFSFYSKKGQDVSARFRIEDISNVNIANFYGNRITEGLTSVTCVIPAGAHFLRLTINNHSGNPYVGEYKMAKLEKGNKRTDWTPAPEDVDSRISSTETSITQLATEVNLKASQTSVNNLTGRMTQAESSLSVQAEQIAARVEKNGVIASINLSSEGLRINGALHHITGQTLIEDGVIGNAAIANASISRAKLQNAIIGSAQIENGVINNAHIGNVSADKINAGRIRGIDIQGSRIYSTSGQDYMTVIGGDIELSKQDGTYLHLNPNGLFGYNSNGSQRFRVDATLVTTSAFGTSNNSVYLGTNHEARVVNYNDIPGDGFVTSYRYLPMRASGYYGNYINVNPAVPGGASSIYARPLSGGEFRVTLNETTTNYQNLRADWLYGNRLIVNALQGNQSHFYLGSLNDGELRVVNNDSTDNWRAVRASGFYGDFIDKSALSGGVHMYVRPGGDPGELRVTVRGSTTAYRPVRASDFLPPSSSRTTKKHITEYQLDVLNVFRDTNVYLYNYNWEDDVASRRIGIMLEEAPTVIHAQTQDTIDTYSMAGYMWKGIKDLVGLTDQHTRDIQALRDEVLWLKLENQYMKQKIKQLECRIEAA